MDIGPCGGDSCPFAQTHGLITCGSPTLCLESRRITLDQGKRPATYMLPGRWQGRGKNRHRSVCIITGRLQPDGYYKLAQEAEAIDGLTSAWPPDWQIRKCESSEKGHCWYYRDDDGRDPCQAPNGSSHWHDDGDEPEHIANATRRRCHHCPEAQLKRSDGHWSGSRDGCPCCEELPSEHSEYHCGACGTVRRWRSRQAAQPQPRISPPGAPRRPVNGRAAPPACAGPGPGRVGGSEPRQLIKIKVV